MYFLLLLRRYTHTHTHTHTHPLSLFLYFFSLQIIISSFASFYLLCIISTNYPSNQNSVCSAANITTLFSPEQQHYKKTRYLNNSRPFPANYSYKRRYFITDDKRRNLSFFRYISADSGQ